MVGRGGTNHRREEAWRAGPAAWLPLCKPASCFPREDASQRESAAQTHESAGSSASAAVLFLFFVLERRPPARLEVVWLKLFVTYVKAFGLLSCLVGSRQRRSAALALLE